ncbi:MAG TPA: hypothetical protein PLO89_11215, partial [Spirochaetota bacterium]|nr:hypothetical protein [Spirochaetota bacterium]
MNDGLMVKEEIENLTNKINDADRAYYVDSSPVMSDAEYDEIFERLKKLERDYPDLKLKNSPTS